MAKIQVSVRLPWRVAEQVDAYAETHDISRTDTLTLFAVAGLQSPGEGEAERAYTTLFSPDTVKDVLENHIRPTDMLQTAEELAGFQVQHRIAEPDPEEAGERDDVPFGARMPPTVVARLEAEAESQDRPRSVVAAEVIERGMRTDPLPDGYEPSGDGQMHTVALEPDAAELFRKYRLTYRKTPDDGLREMLSAVRAGKSRKRYTDW